MASFSITPAQKAKLKSGSNSVRDLLAEGGRMERCGSDADGSPLFKMVADEQTAAGDSTKEPSAREKSLRKYTALLLRGKEICHANFTPEELKSGARLALATVPSVIPKDWSTLSALTTSLLGGSDRVHDYNEIQVLLVLGKHRMEFNGTNAQWHAEASKRNMIPSAALPKSGVFTEGRVSELVRLAKNVEAFPMLAQAKRGILPMRALLGFNLVNAVEGLPSDATTMLDGKQVSLRAHWRADPKAGCSAEECLSSGVERLHFGGDRAGSGGGGGESRAAASSVGSEAELRGRKFSAGKTDSIAALMSARQFRWDNDAAEAIRELANVDKDILTNIRTACLRNIDGFTLGSISGMNAAKRVLYNKVVRKLHRPDLYARLKKPMGLLLYGPPVRRPPSTPLRTPSL